MSRRAREGACLETLVKMAVPVCRQAERACPRSGPGCKPQIPDWVMAVLIMIAVLKRRKSKSAQYRFLHEHRGRLMGWLGVKRFPSRSTYFDRYRRAHRQFQHAIALQSQKAICAGLVDPETVAVDKSLVEARGPAWHRKDRLRGRVPPGVDTDSTWTYSEHHGWVQGYGYEVVVSAGKNGFVWPLLASVDPAHQREHRCFPSKIAQLPGKTRYVLADTGYDSNALAEAIEWHACGKPTGRRFLCPLQQRYHPRRKHPWRETHERRLHRERRQARRAYLSSAEAKRLYARRSTSVEPFNEWFKSLFELDQRAWHRGLDNNRTQILAALFIYQLLLRYNHRRKQHNGQVRWILDIL